MDITDDNNFSVNNADPEIGSCPEGRYSTNMENENSGESERLLPSSDRQGSFLEVTSVDASRAGRNLRTFAGVFCPVSLSQFSTLLFLRMGFVVGQSGLWQTILELILGYFILYMTVLSICAISTNGAVEGGGAYYMISRALGPEFGGSIGLLFFLANVFSCALYVVGFVEALVDNFGEGGALLHTGASGLPVHPNNRWWLYLYATVILLLCLGISLVGGAMFARTSLVILGMVFLSWFMLIVSTFVKNSTCIEIPPQNNLTGVNTNQTGFCQVASHKVSNTTDHGALYTGYTSATFKDNLNSNYTVDYMTGKTMNFAKVFAVLFSSITGIMNGANMSGELKDPSLAIPRGTLAAVTFTFTVYIITTFVTSATASRALLINNYNYVTRVNLWSGFVIMGIFASTLSAALGNLIGGSRILQALAKDQIFWNILKPATRTVCAGNPVVAVLITYALVQVTLLIGSLNAIAPYVTVLFLLIYMSTNLACLALEVASAPNFRPTFRFFSWHTCVSGMLGCIIMMFLINPGVTAICLLTLFLLVVILHVRSLPTTWGSISQALIFHQVRKYLLLLDSRKEHVKFWRPQVLLLVANPRQACHSIDFINDIKKGGLYVLGHVIVSDFDQHPVDPCAQQYPQWLNLIDKLKIKAFVELTLSPSIREGMHQLIRLSGLGGMKPNTICLGFYDECAPLDSLERLRQERLSRRHNRLAKLYGAVIGDASASDWEAFDFPAVRGPSRALTEPEYVAMIYDAIKMNKNVCIMRGFHQLDKNVLFRKGKLTYVDVWPLNFLRPEMSTYFDNTCLFVLQLACILNMVTGWSSYTKLRVFMCVQGPHQDVSRKEKKLQQLLAQLRIPSRIKMINWEHITSQLPHNEAGAASGGADASPPGAPTYISPFPLPAQYLQQVNALVRGECENTAVSFMYLPKVPGDSSLHVQYLKHLEVLTDGLPPTVLVHGLHPVTSTTL